MQDMQVINAENIQESLRIQREESQRIQKLQTETGFLGAHALNQQSDVLKTAATNLGSMGSMGGMDMSGGGGGGGGMNPAGVMTGMMLGGAMGNQMAGMMNQMGQTMNQPQQHMPPPPPQIHYFVSFNGQSSGPFILQQLQQMVLSGHLTLNSFVWKPGMAGWEMAGNVQELSSLFATPPPPPPPPPPSM